MSLLIRGVAWMMVCLAIAAGMSRRVQADSSAGALFQTKCTGCHTFGQGIRVGPDLKHVTDRHPRSWLIAWIKSSAKVIASGDPIAIALFRSFKEQRMPDHDLSDAQIGELLDFLAANGPDAADQRRLRDASSATAADVEWGRQLFYGESKLKSGDLACVACHTVSREREHALGGRFADDLTDAYRRYHDRALDQVLKQPCLPRMPALALVRAEDHESLALRGFLRAIGSATR